MAQFLTANLAYRYLAFALMVSQANWFCQTLGLPRDHTFTLGDVERGSSVGPVETNGVGGSLIADGYFFGFDAGHICSFVKRGHGAKSDADVKRQNVEWSRHTSLIDTNEAIRLASNWLAKSGVKVSALTSNYRMTVTQWSFYPRYQPTNSAGAGNDLVLLPIFQIEWHGDYIRKGMVFHRGPVAKVVISGITKELWECDVFSEQLVKVPLSIVKDLKGVLSISDQDFKGYDDLQRSNFVAQYGNVVSK
jgi:hypothetical protein